MGGARRLGFPMAVALVVGNVVGSGVYLLPASLAPHGRNGVLAWAFVGAGVLCLALVFAALGRALPREGGPYAYTRAAFGEGTAFVVAWSYWVSVWVGNAALATAGASYASALGPGGDFPGGTTAGALAAVWALTLVNAYGIRAAGWVQAVTTVLKLLPLVAVAAAGAAALGRGTGVALADAPVTLGGVTAAATLALWALVGFEAATVPAEKVEDPVRTVPRATVVGTVIAAVACTLACTATLLLVPAGELAASSAPLADAAGRLWGGGASLAVAALASVSAFGALNGWILLQGEMPYALARDGLVPRAFGRVSRRQTPVFALVTGSLLVSLLLLAHAHRGTAQVFTAMIRLSTTANLVAYLGCALALLELARRRRLAAPLRPGLAAAAVAGVAFSLWAMAGAGREALLSGAGLLAAGAVVHTWGRRQVAVRHTG